MSGENTGGGKVMDEKIRNLRTGMKYGIWLYAHWLDGIQYVGTRKKTLKDAIDEVNRGALDESLLSAAESNIDRLLKTAEVRKGWVK